MSRWWCIWFDYSQQPNFLEARTVRRGDGCLHHRVLDHRHHRVVVVNHLDVQQLRLDASRAVVGRADLCGHSDVPAQQRRGDAVVAAQWHNNNRRHLGFGELLVSGHLEAAHHALPLEPCHDGLCVLDDHFFDTRALARKAAVAGRSALAHQLVDPLSKGLPALETPERNVSPLLPRDDLAEGGAHDVLGDVRVRLGKGTWSRLRHLQGEEGRRAIEDLK